MPSPERKTETVTVTRDRTSGGADSEEELILQRMAARRSQSKSPIHSAHKGRSVSHTITTTTETVSIFEDDNDGLRQSTLQQSPMRVSKTRSPSRRSGGEDKAKVRKTSSRIASTGTQAVKSR
ncbi:cell division control protein 14 [Elasticomyces elasticus]|nr:cell division control protein 14 [Elasticomyces elasticus]